MTTELRGTTPVLRIFDLPLAKAFYVDYLGGKVDWEASSDGGPVYLQVSRGAMVLHLSSHHGDGTPGGVALIEVTGIDELCDELHTRGYRFFNPSVEPGPAEGMVSMELIDPFGNQVRFVERRVT